MNKRKKAILKRNLFLCLCAVVIIAVIALAVFVISAISGREKEDNSSENSESSSSTSETSSSSSEEEKGEEIVEIGGAKLDANYTKLLLVNGKNPLPEDYDYEGNLTTIPQKYIKGSLTQID